MAKAAAGRAGVKKHDDGGGRNVGRVNLAPAEAKAAQNAWAGFIDQASSVHDAAEAVYKALFESQTPAVQEQFVTPMAVMAVNILDGISSLVAAMGDAALLQTTVETLAFLHIRVEVTKPRASNFRDALLELMEAVLGPHFDEQARNGMSALLDYVGDSMVFVRTDYTDRLELLAESWRQAHDQGGPQRGTLTRADTVSSGHSGSGEQPEQQSNGDSNGNGLAYTPNGSKENPAEKGGRFAQFKARFRRGRRGSRSRSPGSSGDNLNGSNGHSNGKAQDTLEGAMDSQEQQLKKDVKKESLTSSQAKTPTTFSEMFYINAAVMGLRGNSLTWMNDIIESFDPIVTHVEDSIRVQEEVGVLVLRLAKHPAGTVQLNQFRSCMLAALRSLLPKTWTTGHEEAWTWMWDNVSRLLSRSMDKPAEYEKALERVLESMDERDGYEYRKAIYAKFFDLCPLGQDYFKQSNTRLQYIAERVLAMTLDIYRSPKKLVSEISGVGLRHVGFGIPTDLFGPFVTASVEVMRNHSRSDKSVEAYRWALGLISKIMVRTMAEGSTLVMKAINNNSMKQLKSAIASSPRKLRASWLLDIQVGDQHISPLSWAIESGSLKVAEAIIKDLLTIRADRANYYYGVDELFRRHSDIVKRLCEEAPMLLPTLLEGLVWRSHRTTNGMRRVNLYVKHMLINHQGKFSDALQWISSSGDPSLVSQPVVNVLTETVWSGVVLRQFVKSRTWNIVSLLVFIGSQEILPDMLDQSSQVVRIAMFAGRMFNYVVGLGRLACVQLNRIWLWCRNTMRKIIEEIDTDGNGQIDREEMIEAIHRFNQTVRDEIKKALKVLKDEDGPGNTQEARKAIANQEKQWNNYISLTLMVLLAAMCTHEPMFWCRNSEEWPTGDCEASKDLTYRYSIFSMIAMIVHWLILIDLAVFNTDISAFLLVIGHVLAEVKQFMTALAFFLLTFGSAISILCRNCPQLGGNFSDMPNAIVSLFAITIGLYQGDFRDVEEDPLLLYMVFIFVFFSVVLLLNLLIAQLNRSYEYIYKDMLGFARLNRSSLIVEAMDSCPKAKWAKFVKSLKFDERIEFDEGDLGLRGGIQKTEHASLHRQTKESIRRYGGSTSPDLACPKDKQDSANDSVDAEDRLERMEAMILKTLNQLQSGGKRGGGGSSSMMQKNPGLTSSKFNFSAMPSKFGESFFASAMSDGNNDE
jgi:hemoglobin-like flavoprotein